MRLTLFLSLGLAFTIGCDLTPGIRPVAERVRPDESLRPSFSPEEATAMVGHNVRCIYRTATTSGGCEIGQRGKVVGIEQVRGGGYFIVVHWDGQNPGQPAHYGRYSRRLFLAEE